MISNYFFLQYELVFNLNRNFTLYQNRARGLKFNYKLSVVNSRSSVYSVVLTFQTRAMVNFLPLVFAGTELSNNVSKLPPKLWRNEKMSPFCRLPLWYGCDSTRSDSWISDPESNGHGHYRFFPRHVGNVEFLSISRALPIWSHIIKQLSNLVCSGFAVKCQPSGWNFCFMTARSIKQKFHPSFSNFTMKPSRAVAVVSKKVYLGIVRYPKESLMRFSDDGSCISKTRIDTQKKVWWDSQAMEVVFRKLGSKIQWNPVNTDTKGQAKLFVLTGCPY